MTYVCYDAFDLYNPLDAHFKWYLTTPTGDGYVRPISIPWVP